MKTIRHIALLLGLTLGALAAFDGYAQSVPSLINYQGKLTDAGGNPLPNGTYGVAFRIWNKKAPGLSGEQLIWGQEYTVAVQNGMFNVILGAQGGSPITNAAVNDLGFAFNEVERFIGLTVDRGTNGAAIPGAVEIVPRQQVLAAPYALQASRAQLADNVINGVPTGSVIQYSSSVAPSGWLLCDGAAVSRNAYPNLFSVIGTSYGSGDGSTTFNLPNHNGRVVFGRDATQTEFAGIGQTGGEKEHMLTVAEMPAHSHGGTTYGLSGSTKNQVGMGLYSDPNQGAYSTSSTGGSQAHNNLPPYLVMNYIIKL